MAEKTAAGYAVWLLEKRDYSEKELFKKISEKYSEREAAEAVAKMYEGDAIERFRLNCIEERKRFSWEEMCTRIAELYEMVR